MPTVTIDNVEYDTESMSEEAIANLRSLQFVDSEIAKLQAKVAAMNTARVAYANALQELLPKTSEA